MDTYGERLQNFKLYFMTLEDIERYIVRAKVKEADLKGRWNASKRVPKSWKEAYLWMSQVELKRQVMSEREICDNSWQFQTRTFSFSVGQVTFEINAAGQRSFGRTECDPRTDQLPKASWRWKVGRDGVQYIKVGSYPKLTVERCEQTGIWLLSNKFCFLRSLPQLSCLSSLQALGVVVGETGWRPEFALSAMALCAVAVDDSDAAVTEENERPTPVFSDSANVTSSTRSLRERIPHAD